MTSVDDAVRNFASFLSESWHSVSILIANDPEARADWLQASWEILVEQQVLQSGYLMPYGEGADCYGESSRVFRPDAEPTHVIVCRAKADLVRDALSGKVISFPETGLVVSDLVGYRVGEPYYRYDPPFDHMLAVDPNVDAMPRLVLPLAGVRFEVRTVTDAD